MAGGGPVRRRVAAAAALTLLGSTCAHAANPAAEPGLAGLPATAPRLGACGAKAGAFRLPGTDGCLRIGGFVAAESGWTLAPANLSLGRGPGPGRPAAAGANLSGASLAVGMRLSADLRLPTEAGPVRVFVSVRGRNGPAIDRPAR